MRNALSDMPLLLTHRTFAGVPAMLTMLAFIASASLFLLVTGGLWAFLHWYPPGAGDVVEVYRILAALATVLLVIPAASLGMASAKLSARRHDQRLSTLSLMGASTATITILAIAEPLVLATVGLITGIGGYFLLLVPVSQIPFQGAGLGFENMMLPLWLMTVVLAGLLLICLISNLTGLRRVSISPLGVRARALDRTFPLIRIIVAVAVGGLLFAGITAVKMVPLEGGIIAAILLSVVAGGFLVVNVIGVLVVRLIAHLRAKRAQTAEKLIAARMLSDEPKQYWRRASGIAMTAFIATFAGTGVALMQSTDQPYMTPAEMLLAADVRTGVLLTLGISFVLITVSAVLNQAVDIYDRRDTYETLGAAGMQPATMHRINVAAVMTPVVWVSAIAASIGLLLVAPLAGFAMVTSPVTMGIMLASIVLGALIVRAGLSLTRPLTGRMALAA